MFDWESRKPRLSIVFETEERCTIGEYSLIVNRIRPTKLNDFVSTLIDLNQKEIEVLNSGRNKELSAKRDARISREASHPYNWIVEHNSIVGAADVGSIGGRAKNVEHAKQCAEAAYKIFGLIKEAVVGIMDSR